MSDSSTYYIDVVLPLPLADTYTYSVPAGYEKSRLQKGVRVIVPLGHKKFYTGILWNIHTEKPQNYAVKSFIDVLDEKPILFAQQLDLWKWLAGYYQCTLGEVYKAALPASLKLESETIVSLNDVDEEYELSPKEELVYQVLINTESLTVSELQKQAGLNNILPTLKQLIEKGLIAVSEEIKNSYRPKTETCVTLSDDLKNEDSLTETLNLLSRSPKQHQLVMNYLDMAGYSVEKEKYDEVSKKELLKKSGISQAVLNALIKKNILQVYNKHVSRISNDENTLMQPFTLNNAQEKAKNKITQQFARKNVVLLHGVTSSGKTEVYIHLIKETLQAGKQVLFLLPEIALTTQITNRLKKVFGNELGIYHSKFSDNERVEIWNNLLDNKGYNIVLGVRSSVFLPFRNLGLIIVDEEHENTYKQFDPAPRYHARNAAIILAGMHNAKTLLGTATPSVESYYNAKNDKYGYVHLNQRHEAIELPEIIAVDTKELRRKKIMKSHYSPLLIEKITDALARKEQIILFQNRRGFAPYVECASCAWVPKCKNCDVRLTYHKSFNQLTCHYCGYTHTIPSMCPSCGSHSLEKKGLGTEKIETDIEQLFPEARIVRMDMDTTRAKNAYEKIISDFESHNIDILVGTQMISKGLDFEKVSVVGVLNADNLLNFPDFRAHERAFQLLTQVSGRAGRKNKRGLVIIQTSETNHPVIKQVISNDYEQMFQQQLQERQMFRYPPFYRLMYLHIKHKDSAVLSQAVLLLGNELRKRLGSRVLGPETPPVSRVKNYYIKRFMIKVEIQSSAERAKEIIQEIIAGVKSNGQFKSLLINFDVDPM